MRVRRCPWSGGLGRMRSCTFFGFGCVDRCGVIFMRTIVRRCFSCRRYCIVDLRLYTTVILWLYDCLSLRASHRLLSFTSSGIICDRSLATALQSTAHSYIHLCFTETVQTLKSTLSHVVGWRKLHIIRLLSVGSVFCTLSTTTH